MDEDYDDYDDDGGFNDDDQDDSFNDEDNSASEDNEHPYGSDPEDENEDKGDSAGNDEEKSGIKGMIAGLRKKPNLKKMKAVASANDFGPHIPAFPCPGCKQASLFSDKIIPTGVRATVSIAKACIGVFSAEKDLNILRFVCLNSKCKHFWPRTGDKFMMNVANPGKLVLKKNPFHVNK